MRTIPAARESKWPLLASEGYEKTSDETWSYNCVAFAADVESQWWWPDEEADAFWPPGVQREETVAAFVKAYGTLGYEVCADGTFEEGFEKVAIYALNGIPTHAAKQTPSRKWKSKLGACEDIEHNTTTALEGAIYGHAETYLKRPHTPPKHPTVT